MTSNKIVRFVRPIKILGQSYDYAQNCVEQNESIDDIISEFKSTRKVKEFLTSLIEAKKMCSVQQSRISQLYNDTVRKLLHINSKALDALIKEQKLPRSFSHSHPFSENYAKWP